MLVALAVAALALTSGASAGHSRTLSQVSRACLNSQCGGKGHNGPQVCVDDAFCRYENEYFSICVDSGNEGRRPYENCGGKGYPGLTNCLFGWNCVAQDPYYSQCLPPKPANCV